MAAPAQKAVADALLQARRAQRRADAAPLEGLLASAEEAYGVQERVGREAG